MRPLVIPRDLYRSKSDLESVRIGGVGGWRGGGGTAASQVERKSKPSLVSLKDGTSATQGHQRSIQNDRWNQRRKRKEKMLTQLNYVAEAPKPSQPSPSPDLPRGLTPEKFIGRRVRVSALMKLFGSTIGTQWKGEREKGGREGKATDNSQEMQNTTESGRREIKARQISWSNGRWRNFRADRENRGTCERTRSKNGEITTDGMKNEKQELEARTVGN